MADKNYSSTGKANGVEWLVRGVLTKLGESFDQFTGRNWKPSSNLATSEIIERLKILLDAEAKDLGAKGTFVPHNIKLLMQWDKFSTDSEAALKKLEYELLTAAVDHINDNRYHTYAPLELEIKQDYFTDGVKLSASYEKFADGDENEIEVKVSVPDDLRHIVIDPPTADAREDLIDAVYVAEFTIGNAAHASKLNFHKNERLSIGRTRENDLIIDDRSVSKIHASLLMSAEGQLMVADTGSTNGTFINDKRISYGKAFEIKAHDKLTIGTVEVRLKLADAGIGDGGLKNDTANSAFGRENNSGETPLPAETVKIDISDSEKK